MTDFADWQDRNSAYLAAAIRWLRLRLELCAQKGVEGLLRGPSQRTRTPEESPDTFYDDQSSSLNTLETETGVFRMRERRENVDADVAQAAARMAKAEAQTQPPSALVMISQTLGLARFEHRILL